MQTRNEADNGAGHIEAGRQNFAALGRSPQSVADRLTGEIDDGIDPGVIGQLTEISDQRDRQCQQVGLGRIADQRDHPMAGACQASNQPTPDKTGGAGDKDGLRAR